MSQDLTPDDLWVARLHRRANDVAPEVPVAVGAAIAQGRRRRAVRRASAAAAVAAAAVVIALGAAPATRLFAADARPVQPGAEASVIVATAEQRAARDRDLARKAEQNGIVNPPEVAVVRWITRSDEVFVMADCLLAAGYEVTNVSADGYDMVVPADQEAASTLADYVCGAQYPVAAP